ncbi:DNA helicase PcrA [soil metagenome]
MTAAATGAVARAPLNPPQREAAEHFTGPLLVLAGAGSGKTRVLTRRIAHLVEGLGVDPGSVLAVTFTNKAAGEMRDRVRALLGRDPAGMWIGTFHSIGARILRRDATRLGWTPGFVIYDAADSEALIRRIAKNVLQLDPKRWNPKAIRGAISAAKNELVGVDAFRERASDLFSRHAADTYEHYQRALRDANAFDFDDLLVKPVELFRSHPQVVERYRERFRFILVDEYQDTNRAQYVWLRLLAEAEGNLFVVGDDDQSIYGWRGADIRNILDFEQDFAGARTVRLEQNYRSTRTILDAANRVIAQNVRRKGKTLHTDADAGEPVTLVEAADERDEADWIAGEIRTRLAQETGSTPRDLVILYRTNAQSRSLEEALRHRRIPYRIVGGVRFYERREIKDLLSYLRLVANPSDDEAFLRAVNAPRRGVGDTSLARLGEGASERRISLLEAARGAGEIDELRGPASRALPRFAGMLDKFAALAGREVALDGLIRAVAEESGLLAALREEGPEGEDRLANVDELIAGAGILEARLREGESELGREVAESGLRPLDVFLADVALVSDIDQLDAGADAVSLMTLHNAKGLEFPVVFTAGMEDGLFPLSRTHDEPDELEEERRLFYVGITRARRRLYLTVARRRRRGGEWMDCVPSSFLEALPKELLETRRTARAAERLGGYRRPSPRAPLSRRRERLGFEPPPPPGELVHDYADSQDVPPLLKNSRVVHPTFGAGSVAGLSGTGLDVRASIDFDSVGRKTVVVRYANLRREE